MKLFISFPAFVMNVPIKHYTKTGGLSSFSAPKELFITPPKRDNLPFGRNMFLLSLPMKIRKTISSYELLFGYIIFKRFNGKKRRLGGGFKYVLFSPRKLGI